MSRANVGGGTTIKPNKLTRDERMARYDELPRPLRDVLKYSFIQVSFPGGAACPPEALLEHLIIQQAASTLMTYGPDHPGAQGANQ